MSLEDQEILEYAKQKNETSVKYIEELSLNAWPSHKIELYDGWLIRFSHNYTYRTNSVEQVGVSTIPLRKGLPDPACDGSDDCGSETHESSGADAVRI